MTTETDPTATLEGKLLDFSSTLTEDELTVLHEVLHLAGLHSAEVEGFAGNRYSSLADPCDGGEVTFANTFSMLTNLHTSLHTRRGTRGKRPPG